MTAPSSVAAIFGAASDLIGRGWTQGQGYDGNGYCVVGALAVAANGPLFQPALEAFTAYLGCCPVDWNDAPQRTQAEVVQALRACATEQAAREVIDAVGCEWAQDEAIALTKPRVPQQRVGE